ncbi:MAG TPA: hypothetical protein VF796_01155 [Humisphaera sp.]
MPPPIAVVVLLAVGLAVAAPAGAAEPVPAVEETPAGTEQLIAMLDTPDRARQLAVARVLSDRLPPAVFEGRPGVLRDYASDARRALSAKAWRAEFGPVVRAFAKDLLRRASPDEAAAGASLLVCVGTAEDLPAITEAITRLLEPTLQPAAEPAYMSPVFTPFLAASQAATYRGAEPAADPKTTGEIAVYLGKLSTHRDWNPPGWRERVAGWRKHPSTYIRRIASPPYPLGRGEKAGG